MRTFNIGLITGLLLVGGVASADPAPAGSTQTQDKGDQAFIQRALGVNQLELQLGKLAADRAVTVEIKAMGKKMVEKHTELGQQLAKLAGGSEKVELTSGQKAIYDGVAAQSKTQFDAAFKEVVDAGHVKELAMYREEVSHAKSPALQELVKARVAKLADAVAKAPAPKADAANQEW